MEKHELVGLTLDRLIDHFKVSPESFEFTDNGSPTVIWQPKIQLGDLTTNSVNDPHNTHAVVVRYIDINNQMACYLFLSQQAEPASNIHKADSAIYSSRWFEKYRSNYSKLMKLKKLIEARNAKKANLTYLRKLSSVFPDTLDDRLF